MAFGLAAIDWQAPWLAPYAARGKPLAQRACTIGSVALALNADDATVGPSLPVRFVSQALLPAGIAYESYIFDTQQCPTRDGLHDFFNGLIWHHLPATKTLLNRWQAQAIAQDGIGAARGPLRDALTLFDENLALLACPDSLWDALVQRDWTTLFVTQRALWQASRVLVFGHALLEKLVSPRKGMCAHVLRVPDVFDTPAQLDAQLPILLTPETLQSKPYQPLPVLAIPGWCSANTNPDFYDDPIVFRPVRR